MPKMVEIDKKALICLTQNFAAFYNQCANEVVADFGMPCATCKIYSICRGDWLGTLGPVFEQTGIIPTSRRLKNNEEG